MTGHGLQSVDFIGAEKVGLEPDLLHQSAAVRFGEFCFVSGIRATNGHDVLLPEARAIAGLPFHSSPAELQARVVLERLSGVMNALGGSLEDGVYIEQFFTSKNHFEPYRSVGRQYLPEDRPPSTALPCGALSAVDAVLEVDLTAILTEDHSVRRRISTDDSPKVLGSYAQGVRVRDWIFLAGATPADHTRTSAAYPGAVGTAMAPEARIDPNLWYGSPIERQVEYIMAKKQAAVLEAADSSLERVVKADVYLSHMEEDLRGFHRAWESLFGERAPATTVTPVEGFGSAGSRVEIGIVALAEGSELDLERIHVPSLPPAVGPYPHAVRAGDLLFVSTMIAADERGLVDRARPTAASRNSRPQIIDELEYCMSSLEAICSAGGTTLDNVLRRKNYFTDVTDLFAADTVMRGTWMDAPPASTNVGVTGPHAVPGARLSMDVVAAVHRRREKRSPVLGHEHEPNWIHPQGSEEEQ